MKTQNILKTTFLLCVLLQGQLAKAVEPTLATGKEIFLLTGSNSCSFCHGIDGNVGKIANSAKLSTPKAWRTYKALGGDAEFTKNKAAFLKNFEEALVHLIAKGAIAHNATYKKPYHDFKRAGGPVNAQMLGLGGGPSSAWLSKNKASGMTKEIAAQSVLMHVKSLDTQGVFK